MSRSKGRKTGRTLVNLPPQRAFTSILASPRNQIITPIEVLPFFDPETQSPKDYDSVNCSALWDTGATGSCITNNVVKQLKLAPIRTVKVTHAGGQKDSNVYLVNFHLPNRVGVAEISAVEYDDNPQHDVIIGMDIITRGSFAISNTEGRTCVSFCIPPMPTETDFVKDVNATITSLIGPNDLCLCGSGNKFKKCCRDKYT
ncbi:MAG: hypothetical protein E3J72_09990 [Planctomycetota bacterium]|nr:MAG: hypothetical protein E3J72_09990 [Planctomycetota bacterium]